MDSLVNCTGKETLLPQIVSAYRETLIDSNGRQYVDLESGVWCLALGHNHECTRDVMSNIGQELEHSGFNYGSGESERAAQRVCEFAGLPDGACLFLSSGSEAIEFALQVVAEVAQEGKLITLPKAYFGSYGTTNRRDDSWQEVPWSMEEFETESTNLPTRPAGFLFEPGSTSGEVRFPDLGYVQFVADEVRARGGLVVVNEVTTGAGRTGKDCAYQHSGMTPDIVVMGKGIGNGYPVSAIVLSQQVAEKLKASHLNYMQSHQNDPLGARIVDRVLTVIQRDKLAARAATLGHELFGVLKTLENRAEVREVRGKGLMIAIEFESKEICAAIHTSLLSSGFVTNNRGTMIRIDPPLNINRDTLERFSQCLSDLVAGFTPDFCSDGAVAN